MPESRPLLTIAVPTYNRSLFLAQLLECLLPQLAGERRVELIVSDNASADDTEQAVSRFAQRGLCCRYIRNQENLGADANFLQCLRMARGKYVWVMGDDDLLAPDALALLCSLLSNDQEGGFDLVYLSSSGFKGNTPPQPRRGRRSRFAEVVRDGDYLLEKVNALIGLISVNIVNKDRLLATDHPPIEDLKESNLIQVGWIFPVLHRRCRVLYIFERLVYYRHFNSGGWGICEVFGLRLHQIASRYFALEPSLDRSLMNGVLRYWLPDVIVEMRRGRQQSMNSENFAEKLQPQFAKNWRYWVFVYAVAIPPLVIAIPVHKLNRFLNKAWRGLQAVAHLFSDRAAIGRPF